MEDSEYLKFLRQALDEGAIEVQLNFSKLEHMDSPISVDADSNIWIYVLMFSVSITWLFTSFLWACVAAAVGGTAWFTVGLPWHRRRMKERFHRSVIFDVTEWRQLWRLPGVEMTAVPTKAKCISPDGNWRQFIAGVHNHGATGQT